MSNSIGTPIQTIAILSPGDMGNAVGKMLIEHGIRVVAALDERSPRTRQLAAQAGIDDVGSIDRLVQTAEMILSILVPAQALAAAQQVAAALTRHPSDLLYVDCNAIAPATVSAIDQIITSAGGRFADAGIIGPPPRDFASTRIYTSGPQAAPFVQLRDYGLNVIDLGGAVGRASAFKMCYAALTKGTTALQTQLLTAAAAYDISAELATEFTNSQAHALGQMERGLPGMAAKAHRWVGEMEEIAKTFAAIGLTPDIFTGAAAIYQYVSSTPLGKLTPEDPKPDFGEMVAMLAAHLPSKVDD